MACLSISTSTACCARSSIDNPGRLTTATGDRPGAFQATLAAASDAPPQVRVDVARLDVVSAAGTARFTLSERHRRMFMDRRDMPGASLPHLPAIQAFAQRWQQGRPWLRDAAANARARLDRLPSA